MGILSSVARFVFAEAKPDRFYAEIIHPNRKKEIRLVRLNGSHFTVDKKKYNIDLKDESVIFYTGFWRVPSAEYFWNVKEPLARKRAADTAEKNAVTPISAEDAFEATESHVISETLRSFMGEAISQTMGFTLVLIASVAGPVILYVVLSNKLREMTDLLTQIAAAHGVQVR